jgi:mRNA interferase RelE/StbE
VPGSDARWQVFIDRDAEKELHGLPRPAQRRVLARIRRLAADPFPPGCRKLTGQEDLYRLRVGVWRVIYHVDRDVVTVLVLRIGHRRDVYRSL